MRRLALALLAATALSVAAAPAQAQQAIGAASAVKNDVRIRKPGGAPPRPVALRQRIALGDAVQTGPKSQLQVLLLDRSVFTVGANARVTIDRFVYDPGRPSSVGATVTRGAFRFMSGRGGSSGSTIRTPVASIGVRGTILEGVVGPDAALIAGGERGVGGGVRSDPETASLIVLRGPGRATQGGARPGAIDVSAGGRTVTADRPLQAIYVPRQGAAPIGPFPISNSGLMQLQAILHPSVAARLGILGPEDNAATSPDDPSLLYPAPSQPARPPRRLPGRAFDEDAPPAYRGPGNLPNLPAVEPRGRPPQQQPQSQPQSTPQDPAPLRAAPSPNRPADAVPAPAPTPSAGKPVATDAPPSQQQPPPSLKSGPAPTPTPTPTPVPGKKPPK